MVTPESIASLSHRLQSLNLRTPFVYAYSDDVESGQDSEESELNSDQ